MGCASRLAVYGGQKPDFSLSGESAEREIRRFRLEENNFWTCSAPCFESDRGKRAHTWASVLPLIENVSPGAIQRYEKAEGWSKVQLYSLGVGIAGLALGLVSKGNQRDTFYTASLIGSTISIGSSFYVNWLRSDIPEIFNRDLKQRFSPSIGMNWSFQ